MLNGISSSVLSQGKICLDTNEFKEIELIIAEDSVLRANNAELQLQVVKLTRNDSLCTVNKVKYDNSITALNEIIRDQAARINKLEHTPLQIVQEGWRWWEKVLAVLAGVAAGYVTCEIIHLVK